MELADHMWQADAPESHPGPRDLSELMFAQEMSKSPFGCDSNFNDQATPQSACVESSPFSWAELGSFSAAITRINKIFISDSGEGPA